MSDAAAPATDQPTVLILYGGTGDLAKRMVLPAIYELYTRGLLPARVQAGRQRPRRRRPRGLPGPHPRRADRVRPCAGPEQWAGFAANVLFAGGGFQDDDPGSLLDVIAEAEADWARIDLIHYLAIPPVAFADDDRGDPGARAQRPGRQGGVREAVRALARRASTSSTTSSTPSSTRSRSTGSTTSSARRPPRTCTSIRFANRLFGDVWNAEHIAQVQIDVPETLDIADRAGFYDATGAALDMLVTHLFQVAAEVAMEPPLSMRAEDLQAAREAVHLRLPAARPERGGARPVRQLSRDRGHRRRLDHRHLRGRAAVGRHRTAGRACRSCCVRARSWPPAPSG